MSSIQRPKSRLGRGLSSLMSSSELPVEASVTPGPVSDTPVTDPLPTPAGIAPSELLVDSIQPNPHQPRRQFNETALAELAASLKINGLIQPIIVRKTDDGYQLVAGERRLRAAKIAGLTTIPAIVREIDSFTQAQLALVENIQREDLNPLDRATAYRSLITQLGLTQSELAIRLGEDRSTVANFLRLLELAGSVQILVRDGKLSLGHAKLLAGVTDVKEQERLANLVVSQDLSVRNLERLIQQPTAAPATKATPSGPSAHLLDLEKSFARQLGMRVQIRTGTSKSKGRIVIHYASLDQFDQLQERLGISSEE